MAETDERERGQTMYKFEEQYEILISSIETYCAQRGISPWAAARKVGMSTSTMSGLINRNTCPSLYTVIQLCNALNVKISELFGEIGDNFADLEKETVQFFVRYRRLSEQKKEFLRLCLEVAERYEK